MRPRIVTIADHIDCPTGFGVQHRHLALGLARAGFEVHSLGIWDSRPLEALPDCGMDDRERGEPGESPSAIRNPKSAIPGSLTRYPGGLGPDDHRRAWAMYRDLLRPDLVITLGDLRTFAHLARGPRPFAWCHWLPLDALPYPPRDGATLRRLDHLVLMSHFALALVRPRLEGRVPLHLIPHGVDVAAFRPLDDPLAVRRRWTSGATGRPPLRTLDGSPLRPDDFVLISRDANQWRKQQPLLFAALAQLPRDVKLVLHGHPVSHPNARGWDLPLAARQWGVAGRVAFTSGSRASEPGDPGSVFRAGVPDASEPADGAASSSPRNLAPGTRNRPFRDPQHLTPNTQHPAFSPSELAELDNLADLRVSATMGEGFGVLTIEAMACGTPTLITDYTTARELIRGEAGSGCRVPGAGAGKEEGVECQVARVGARSGEGKSQPPTADPQAGPAGTSASPCRNAFSPSPSPGTRNPEPATVPLDRFGPAGELVRVAAWTLEQERHLFRPVIDAADMAAKVLAFRADPSRLARCGVAGLRRVLARYTLGHMIQAWFDLVREVLG